MQNTDTTNCSLDVEQQQYSFISNITQVGSFLQTYAKPIVLMNLLGIITLGSHFYVRHLS